ncbi:asparaginyl/glutamyl-tRNA amidotransferase subunit C [Moraxella caviae]|uniref:Aspartyl/glutamyl-tRNA(Asn/Gln) amidotransferase subunit C n=1 Tax=Moraxella caviae TaxID=34060 RepID=A0A1T0A855_9GAMM|nr:Asp-tRNA(Asn)/Glu-tRNA(Gln) amidotransferase subunit GatC [Moraxella caviae]OOR91913.1 asparaginyl/glutamyl-tRNA amidotransferase subunit C [Moraxella caviae]STZ09768.1 Glutamyl-tRNA(Gln) amidotransferase subunit C [Moraxella caviae]
MSDLISSGDVLNAANLSRLAVDTAQAESYAKDISKILAMMDTLSQVDTDGVLPLANIHEACQTLRPDVPNADIDRDGFQKVAPNVAGGLYLVPQVIE